jgi:hypothetical protein
MNWYRSIEELLWPSGFTRDVWMIVDCARDQKPIFRFLLGCHLEISCLYSGFLPPALEMAAPYLVQLNYDDQETRQLIELSWGNSWGVFLKSGASMKNLRRHLREFLIVRDSQNHRMAFRYYDPRVLRSYLPTCSAEELRTVFGPIEYFWTESREGGEQMLEFSLENSRLVERTRLLARSAGGLGSAGVSGIS